MPLIAGIDSSTQSCKVVVCDLETGRVVREGKAVHPAGTVVDPERWWLALLEAVADAGGIDDVAALSVSAQQSSAIFLDAQGGSVRDAILWNDTASHSQVLELNEELGADEWIRRTGLPLALSSTVTKLRWLRDNEPENARRTAAVALPHDWLTWRLKGHGPGHADFDALTTDRSDASATGYWSGETEEYCPDLFEHAFGRLTALPLLLRADETAGATAAGIPGIPAGIPIGVGSADNAAASLALRLEPGDAVMSLGTSGVVYAYSHSPVRDFSGVIRSYAGATDYHIPQGATLNAARNLDAAAGLLGCTHEELGELALGAAPGSDGLTLLPFFEGERTPTLPDARASLHGASLRNFTRENVARAAIEGTLASQSALLRALQACDVPIDRMLLIGGAAKSRAVRQVLTQIIDLPLFVPEPAEYVAKGASMQAAAVLTGELPAWTPRTERIPGAALEPVILEQRRAAMASLGYPV
jgi:xylulokinase